jgi:hypothetical protein
MKTNKIIKTLVAISIFLTIGIESVFACGPVYSLPRYSAPEINIKNGDVVGINAYSRDPYALKLYKGMLVLFKTPPHRSGFFFIKVKDLRTGADLQQWSTSTTRAVFEEVGEYGSYQIIVGESNSTAICSPSAPVNFTTGPANPIEIKSPANYCPGGSTGISWVNCLDKSTYTIFLYEKGKSKEIFSVSGTTTSNVKNEVTVNLPPLNVTKTYSLKITEKLGTTYFNRTKNNYSFSGGIVETLALKLKSPLLRQSNKKLTLYWDSHLPLNMNNKIKLDISKEGAEATILYTTEVSAKSSAILDLKNVLDEQYDGKYVLTASFMGKKETVKFDYASIAASKPIVASVIKSGISIKQVTLTFTDNRFATQGFSIKITNAAGKYVKTVSFRSTATKKSLDLSIPEGSKIEITIKSSYYLSSSSQKLSTSFQY